MREREDEQTASIIEAANTGDQALSNEVEDSSPEVSGDILPPKVSLVVGSQQPLSPLITSTPSKSVFSIEAEEDAAYAKQVAQRAESRAKEIAELNSNIAKIENNREVTFAAQRRERLMSERRELDRVAE